MLNFWDEFVLLQSSWIYEMIMLKWSKSIISLSADSVANIIKDFSNSVLRLQTYFEGAAASLYLSRVPSQLHGRRRCRKHAGSYARHCSEKYSSISTKATSGKFHSFITSQPIRYFTPPLNDMLHNQKVNQSLMVEKGQCCKTWAQILPMNFTIKVEVF